MKKLSVKELTFTAMLTCCNSVLELVVGNILHLINFSMKGSVLVGLNVMVYTVLFNRIPRFGIITLCGLATAAVNFLLTGGFKFFALYCIVVEALVVDVIFTKFGLNKISVISACVAAGITASLCGFFNGVVFVGIDVTQAAQRISQSPLTLGQPLALIMAFIVVWRIIVGIAFGFISCKILDTLNPELVRVMPEISGNENQAVTSKKEVDTKIDDPRKDEAADDHA